jgi:predicted nuclease of predicted toxin-antitoxin system
MRFLVDTNLPPSVARRLGSLGHDAQHTSDVGLERAKDREIWQHAKSGDLCIVTKDEDFVLLRASDPGGPCVVWVRIGNAIRRIIETRISAAWPTIVSKLSQGDSVVELR